MTVVASVYRQFGRPSGILGHVAGWIMARRPSNRQRNRWTVDLLGIQPGENVLEIGFGPGLSIAQAASLARPGQVVGIDHSKVMFAQASRRNRDAIAGGRVRLMLGGLELLAGLTTRFDKAYSVNAIQFLPDRPAALAALREVLRPSGRLATTYQPRHRGARPEDAHRFAEALSRDLAAAGFTAIEHQVLPLALPAVCVLGRR